MTYPDFELLIQTIQSSQKKSQDAYKLGIDLSNYNDAHFKIIDLLMQEAFGEENKGWIDWFLYERVSPTGKILEAFDKNKTPICYDIPSLWEEIQKNPNLS
jgi:hypothetical protein